MLNLLRATFGLVLAMALLGSAASADQKVTYALDTEVDAYLAASEKTAEKAADNTLKAFWKNGLRLETADKNFKLKMGGRIMFDFGFQSADDDYRTVSVIRHDGGEYETLLRKVSRRLKGRKEYEDVFVGGEGL